MNLTPLRSTLSRRLALAGFTAATFTLALSAQVNAPASNPPAGDELVTLPEFTVSSETADRYRAADAISAVRVRAPLLETPSSISVMTRDMIDDLAPQRIFDVVRYVAGVQEGRGIQFQDRMIIRGFEVTGQRTVDNFLQPGDADNIHEAIIERIEVAKGPNAILAPAGAPGGSLNVITKSPLYRAQRSLTAQVGLYDSQKLTLDVTDSFGEGSPFAYRLIGSLQDSRRYWDEDARLRTKLLAPMFSYRISDRTTLTIKLVAADFWAYREPLLIIDSAVGPDTDDPYLAPGLSKKGRNGIQPWSHVGTHTADLFALLTTSVNENISLRFAANGRYYFEDSTQEFLSTPSLTNRYNPATGELTQDTVWTIVDGVPVGTFSPFYQPNNIPVRGDMQATRRKTGNLQADGVAKYQFGSVSSQTVAGLALSRQTAYGRGHAGALPGVDLGDTDRSVVPVWNYSAFAFYNVNNFTNWQAYVNQRLGFFNDRLFLNGGVLHYDTYTYGRNHNTPGAAGNILDDAKQMWTASGLFKLRDNVALYYSHSTNSAPTIANNQPLWRDGVQDEFGFKLEFFDQRLSLNGSYFEISQTNVTVPNPDRQTNPAAPEQIIQDLSNHGYEFELVGGLTPNLSVIATFSELTMRDSLGRHVRAVADRTASLLLNYAFRTGPAKGFSVNAGVNYSGRRAGDTPINYTPAPFNVVGQTSFFLKPYYVTTLGATYRMNERFLFRLNIDNVFDDKGYIQQAGGRVSGTGITTAPGINIRFSTTLNF